MEVTNKKIVSSLLAKQHSLPLSVALHLVPGLIIVLAYLLIAAPFTQMIGYPPYLAWVIAMCIGLIPVELGLLVYLARKKYGGFSLQHVIGYLDKPTRTSVLIGLVVGLVMWQFLAGALFSPVDQFLYNHLFTWIPFEGVSGTSGYLSGYAHSVIVTTLLISFVLSGIIMPIVEELYFRGFLLPRLSRYGKKAPLLNLALFSLYHFWTPWQLISRIGFFLPTVWSAWRRKDLRISIWAHCISNSIGQVLALAVVMTGGTL